MSIEVETFENKRFEKDDLAKIIILKDDRGDILIREEDNENIIWLNAKTALNMATWILDNVSEVEE